MEFRVLGPLVVRADDRELPLGGPLRRAVLTALPLEPDRMVPTGSSAVIVARTVTGPVSPATAPSTVIDGQVRR